MNNFTTSVRANVTTSVPTDFLSRLERTLNISHRTLIIIGVVAVIVLIVILIFIIRCIKKCLSDKGDKKRKKRKENEKDIFGDDSAKYESKFGYIDISVTYNRKKKKLIISDVQANNLISPSPEAPDCFLKVFLKNPKGKKINIKKTKPKVDNYTPFYNDTFTFTFEKVKEAVVYFQVIDDNPNGNDILLGEGMLDMSTIETDRFIGIICQTYVILEKPSEKVGVGDVCVVITSRPNQQKIVILEAKGLVYKFAKPILVGVLLYPIVYTEVEVFVKNTLKKKFITKKLHNTENPYFMESFDVSIKSSDLKNVCIKIKICESISGRIPKRVGQVYIGNPEVNPKINPIGKLHWDSACNDPNFPKAMWHSLMI